MDYREKIMFVGKNENQIKTLCCRLKEIYHESYTTRKYLDYHLLIANSTRSYYLGLIPGSILATLMNYELKFMDINDEMKYVNDICVCKFYVEKETADVKNLVMKFKSGLSEKISGSVVEKYVPSEHVYEIYIKPIDFLRAYIDSKISFNLSDCYGKILYTLDKILEKIKSYVNSYMLSEDYTANSDLFEKICCYDFYGNVVFQNIIEEHMGKVNLIDYFNNSAVALGIRHPEGSNLSPKEDEKSDYTTEKYFRGGSRYWASMIKSAKMSPLEKLRTGIKQVREYTTHFEEECGLTEKINKRTDLLSFELDDEIAVSYEVEILADNKLIVTSKVSGERKVKGEKLCSKPTVYDALYQNKDYTDGKFTFTVTDYYEIIDLNLLLHYTDASKYYETYKIPVGFRFENGLERVLESKQVIDDMDPDWICYEDISEVKERLLKEA